MQRLIMAVICSIPGLFTIIVYGFKFYISMVDWSTRPADAQALPEKVREFWRSAEPMLTQDALLTLILLSSLTGTVWVLAGPHLVAKARESRFGRAMGWSEAAALQKQKEACARSAIALGRDILEFLSDAEPETHQHLYARGTEDLHQSTQKILMASGKLQARYRERFLVRVAYTASQLDKFGVLKAQDTWGHDTNPIGMRDAATKIGAAGQELLRQIEAFS